MTSKYIITALAVTSTSALLYTIYCYRSVSNNVEHFAQKSLPQNHNIKSLPSDLLISPTKYVILYDRASKSIPSSSLPTQKTPQELLTIYLRETMTKFSTKTPQSSFMYSISKDPAWRDTFAPRHIQSLDFVVGDIVCGAYQVIERTPTQVELTFAEVPGIPPIAGRLVVGLEEVDESLLFSTQTIQWREVGDKNLLPLEKAPLRIMHQVASRWLVESGTNALIAMKAGDS